MGLFNLRSHVLRAYCNFELKQANSITLFGRRPNKMGNLNNATGSRGDVFVVRTSKPVEIMGYFGRVDDRVTVSLQILYTANLALRATCRAPARLWLAVIDFQNGEQQSRSGSDKKRRNRLQ